MPKVKQQDQLPDTKDPGAQLSDILLVERIIDFRQDKKRIAGQIKRDIQELADRLTSRGVTEAMAGTHLLTIAPKLLKDYDTGKLNGLRNCVTDDQLWLTIKSNPSNKQMSALSDLGGAPAKSVIAAAKREIDTGTITLRIRKPRKRGKAKRGHAGSARTDE